jgi:ABC-2 type transport system ATP-binding protein
MTGKASQRMSRYSKGMLQRIGLAQAILLDPPILILDEPLSGLDPAGQKDLRSIIIELQGRGKSIFLCSHLLNEVEKLCTDIAIIYEGRIISQDSTNELLVFNNQFLLRVDKIAQSDLERIGAPFQISCIDDRTCIFEEQRRGDKEALLKTLIEHGAEINELMLNKRSLEDYFILKTGGN